MTTPYHPPTEEPGDAILAATVFARDLYRCVMCNAPATVCHDILSRRLWDHSNANADNAVSLCHDHQARANATEIAPESLRQAAGITTLCIPPQLYAMQAYDKWGNPVLPGERRAKGELFADPEVQAWLARGAALAQFGDWVKYPRTYLLPWSESVSDGDRMMGSMAAFQGQRVIMTEKMDGENTTFYRDYIHARSVIGASHPSRDWVKAFWQALRTNIRPGWRLCGENLYARHTIAYQDLGNYFRGFSAWDEDNVCRPWDETLALFESLRLPSVPVLYDGPFDAAAIQAVWERKGGEHSEGYVLRVAGPIRYRDFRNAVGKFVRAGYQQSEPIKASWASGQAPVTNEL